MSNLWNDLSFALRTLKKSPVFTTVAIFSLALGIGANTAIFSMVDQILLRLLPVKDPRSLVLLAMKGAFQGSNRGENVLSYPMYADFAANNQVFTGMFCRFPTHLSLTFGGQTERVAGELVSGSYFPVLGLKASAGRLFEPEDDREPNGHPLAVLSNSYWKSRFAAKPDVVGKDVIINGHNVTVIGVAEPGFDGVELGFTTQVFIPIMMKAQMTPNWDDLKNRRSRWVNAFGRLQPGITREQARASLQPFMHSMLEMEVKESAFNDATPYVRQQYLRASIEVLPGSQGRSYVRSRMASPLWALLAITGAVLLIACANVANLLIARSAARQKEIAIRLSLGAGRSRLIQQLLVESLFLALAGGGLGLLTALWLDSALVGFLPPDKVSLQLSTTPDMRVLLFTMGVSLVTAVLFGLFPAFQATKPDVAPTLKDQAGAVVGGGVQVQFRKALVTAQVTLSLLLLIGAGLFIRSLHNLRNLGPGFQAGNVIAFNIDPTLNGYNGERTKAFYQRLLEGIRSIPGVQSSGLAAVRILDDDDWENSVTVEGYHAKQDEDVLPYMNSISPGYFQTLGIPVLQGRDFRASDTQEIKHGPQKDDFVPTVAIINEKMAKRYFPNGNALGRHVGFGGGPKAKADMEVIGIVKDVKYTNLRDEIPIQMFVPYLADRSPGGMTVYTHSSLDPNQMFRAIRARARDLDPNLPLYAMRTIENQISVSLVAESLIATLSTVFGALATLLATIGLYGVMAYTVARRTREIGIRMALGALRSDVIWLVMREVLLLVGVGVVLGYFAAATLTRFVQSQLFGVGSLDPVTLIMATIGLAAVAFLAGLLPALRASRVDAMHALRYE